MRRLFIAAGIALGGHGVLLRPRAMVSAVSAPPAPFVWLAAPPAARRPGVNRSGGFSSIKSGEAGSGLASPVPQWKALGDLLAMGNRPPEYPPEALDRQWEGVVRVLVEFGENGNAERVAVEESSGHGVLDRAALEAARHWHLSEEGAKRSLLVPVAFRLSDEG